MIKNYDIAGVILKLYPGACVRLENNDFDTLVWDDVAGSSNPIPRPTEAEMDAAGATFLLEAAQEAKKEEIDKARDAAIDAPVLRQINGEDKYFSVEILHWDNSALTMDLIETIQWYCEDESVVSINKADILALCSHIRTRFVSTAAAAKTQKDDVMALTTVEDVEAYTVTF